MKQFYNILMFVFLVVPGITMAQLDSIQHLEEVVVKGYLPEKKEIINISTDSISQSSLTDVIRFKTPIFLKDYGGGMLSSISFRGTSASHTSVLWNGIPINSKLNGQTDSNMLSIANIDEISVKTSSGNIIDGAGLGGTINLKNSIEFQPKSTTQIRTTFGSYQTYQVGLKTRQSTETVFINIGANYKTSENDYPFLKTKLKNENAQYKLYDFNGNFGWKIDDNNQLKGYFSTMINDRNIGRSLNAPSKSKLKYNTFRNLLQWENQLEKDKKIIGEVAYLKEHYNYLENKSAPEFSSGNTSKTFISKFNYQQKLNNGIHFNTFLNYENSEGNGDNIESVTRNETTFVASAKHRPFDFFSYELQLQKGFSNVYKIPFLYAIHMGFYPFKNYKVSLNHSKNFRQPTINDLYWIGGGNPDLQPEHSFQFENTHEFEYKKWLRFSLTGFYLKNRNLIRWLPNSGGVWQPQNIDGTKHYGTELLLTIKKGNFWFNNNYAYTNAINLETKKQLVYVPKHQLNLELAYHFKKLQFVYGQLFNGSVFAFTEELPKFSVANVEVIYHPLQKIKIRGKVNNVFDTAYQTYQYYPMPPRNYQIEIQINI